MTTSPESARNDLPKTKEINYLNESLVNLEQYTRKNKLEFHGVPENSYRFTKEAILKIAAAPNVQVIPSVIEISHKLRRKNDNSIISFVATKWKPAFIKHR